VPKRQEKNWSFLTLFRPKPTKFELFFGQEDHQLWTKFINWHHFLIGLSQLHLNKVQLKWALQLLHSLQFASGSASVVDKNYLIYCTPNEDKTALKHQPKWSLHVQSNFQILLVITWKVPKDASKTGLFWHFSYVNRQNLCFFWRGTREDHQLWIKFINWHHFWLI